jgi:hypothetical protein
VLLVLYGSDDDDDDDDGMGASEDAAADNDDPVVVVVEPFITSECILSIVLLPVVGIERVVVVYNCNMI